MKTPEKSDKTRHLLVEHKRNGNSADVIARLRLLISDLINEVESIDQSPSSLSATPLPENCDSFNFYDEVTRFEIILIKSALRRTHGHQIHAAHVLNLNPSTLNSKIKQYRLRQFLGLLLDS